MEQEPVFEMSNAEYDFVDKFLKADRAGAERKFPRRTYRRLSNTNEYKAMSCEDNVIYVCDQPVAFIIPSCIFPNAEGKDVLIVSDSKCMRDEHVLCELDGKPFTTVYQDSYTREVAFHVVDRGSYTGQYHIVKFPGVLPKPPKAPKRSSKEELSAERREYMLKMVRKCVALAKARLNFIVDKWRKKDANYIYHSYHSHISEALNNLCAQGLNVLYEVMGTGKYKKTALDIREFVLSVYKAVDDLCREISEKEKLKDSALMQYVVQDRKDLDARKTLLDAMNASSFEIISVDSICKNIEGRKTVAECYRNDPYDSREDLKYNEATKVQMDILYKAQKIVDDCMGDVLKNYDRDIAEWMRYDITSPTELLDKLVRTVTVRQLQENPIILEDGTTTMRVKIGLSPIYPLYTIKGIDIGIGAIVLSLQNDIKLWKDLLQKFLDAPRSINNTDKLIDLYAKGALICPIQTEQNDTILRIGTGENDHPILINRETAKEVLRILKMNQNDDQLKKEYFDRIERGKNKEAKVCLSTPELDISLLPGYDRALREITQLIEDSKLLCKVYTNTDRIKSCLKFTKCVRAVSDYDCKMGVRNSKVVLDKWQFNEDEILRLFFEVESASKEKPDIRKKFKELLEEVKDEASYKLQHLIKTL